jgi:putative resolvase
LRHPLGAPLAVVGAAPLASADVSAWTAPRVAAGKEVAEYLEEVGSGLDYKRKHFLRLMEMVERGEVAEIVVAHKDRLVRLGFEFFEKFCADHGCSLTVMNAESSRPRRSS